MKNTNEELIVEALPHEQYIEKLIQNDPSSIEKIILKYFKDCRNGTQHVEDYEEYLVNQLMYRYYHYLYEGDSFKELTIEECNIIISDQKLMIKNDKEFFKKNQYHLKKFPIYNRMILNYYIEIYNTKILIPSLLKQIEEIKKENETL